MSIIKRKEFTIKKFGNYELEIPLKGIIRFFKDGLVVCDVKEIEIFSFGDSEEKVIKQIIEEISNLYRTLNGLDDGKLGRYLLKWKNALQII